MTGHTIAVKETRRWQVVIDRGDAAWPDLPRDGRGPGLRVDRLTFCVDIAPDGALEDPGVVAVGRNVRKDGSLGAPSNRWLWPTPPEWVVPLAAEALERIAATPWPVPVAATRAEAAGDACPPVIAACGRCGNPVARPGETSPVSQPGAPGLPTDRSRFCDPCIDRCHEATDFAHICQICASPEEARARGWAATP